MEAWQQPTLAGFLERLSRWNIPFRTVIDVGASNGLWTRDVIARFPDRQYFLVEARPEHESGLKDLVAAHPQVRYELCAAADRPGEVHFHGGDLFGGLAAHTPFSEHNLVVRARTLDELVATHGLSGPFLLKLDTHGFEEQILAGAPVLLAQTEVLVIEAYNHRMGYGNLLFPELIALLGRQGFRCVDFFDPLYRPHDGAFWQADFAFVRETWAGFTHPSYQ